MQKAENLNKVKEAKVIVVSTKTPTENLKVKESKVVANSKPSPVEKPKNITPTVTTVADTPEEVFSKQNSTNAKNTAQKDSSSSLPTPEKQTFEKITSPVEVTPEPPASEVKKSVIAMGRLLEPRSNQPIGKYRHSLTPT